MKRILNGVGGTLKSVDIYFAKLFRWFYTNYALIIRARRNTFGMSYFKTKRHPLLGATGFGTTRCARLSLNMQW